MRGRLVLLVVAIMVAIGTLVLGANGTSADNSHVEYVVEPQDGISVVQHGRAGLVEVTVTDCLVAGEPFTFDMIVSSSRDGDSDLSVRKNSGVDISSWFSLNPEVVDLPSETTVTVSITPPADTELDRKTVARIQEIGDPPAPGGHHGVKVRLDCVTNPISVPPEVGTPVSQPPVEEPTPTPEPQMPTELPDSGGEPPSSVGSPRAEFVILGILGMAAPVFFLIWRRLHLGFF